MRRCCTLAIVLVAACRGQGREQRAPHGNDFSGVPEEHELSTVPSLGVSPIAMEVTDHMAGPETVFHDPERDVYFVSNIRGSANESDDDGYISIVSPAGEVIDPFFIDGRSPGVELHAPRGMVVGGNTLYVADEGGIRLFDRTTGDPQGVWPVPEAHFLNGLTIDGQGHVLATETAIDLLPTGPVKKGPYTIYSFDANGTKSVLAQGDDLQGPNGIISTPAGVLVIEFMGDEHGIYRLDDKGGKHLIAQLPFGELDGIAAVPDGSLLVSSWFANGVYRVVPGQPPVLVVEHMVTPAGIDYDAIRHRILIPEVLGNALHIEPWAPPSGKLQAMEDRWAP
jgi:hypothetical protein